MGAYSTLVQPHVYQFKYLGFERLGIGKRKPLSIFTDGPVGDGRLGWDVADWHFRVAAGFSILSKGYSRLWNIIIFWHGMDLDLTFNLVARKHLPATLTKVRVLRFYSVLIYQERMHITR